MTDLTCFGPERCLSLVQFLTPWSVGSAANGRAYPTLFCFGSRKSKTDVKVWWKGSKFRLFCLRQREEEKEEKKRRREKEREKEKKRRDVVVVFLFPSSYRHVAILFDSPCSESRFDPSLSLSIFLQEESQLAWEESTAHMCRSEFWDKSDVKAQHWLKQKKHLWEWFTAWLFWDCF